MGEKIGNILYWWPDDSSVHLQTHPRMTVVGWPRWLWLAAIMAARGWPR